MKTADARASRGRHGFTLVEVMTAVGVMTIIFAALIVIYSHSQQRMYSQGVKSEMYDNLRFGMNSLETDMSMAGYGLPVSASSLSSWITWVSGVTNSISIIAGTGTGSDTILIAAAFDRAASTTVASAKSANSITVNTGSPFSDSRRRLVFLGQSELLRVTGVNGSILTVSSLPTTAQGLRYAHPAGETVDIVDVIRYTVRPATGGNPPYLRRERTTATEVEAMNQVVAEGINRLKVAPTNTMAYSVIMGVQALRTDRWATNRVDRLHRDSVTNVVYKRNRR